MPKHLFLSVSCVNSDAFEVPQTFYIELDDALKKRIQELADAVKSLGVLYIEDWCSQGTWSDLLIEYEDVVHADEAGISDALRELEEAASRVDIQTLSVYDDGFRFGAVPKHCDDDLAVCTRKVKLSELSNNEPYIDLS